MKYLVNSHEMRSYDLYTSEVLKVPSLLLMEQAALTACEEIEKIADKKEKILIICGTGNNGGDGLAVGRILFLRGYQIELVLLGDEKKASEQNKKQQEILIAYGITLQKEIPNKNDYKVIIDAIFGVGLTRKIEGTYQTAIEVLNRMTGYKIALDIPSGVSADNGNILGIAFYADKTITFAFDKIGLHLWPGNEAAGNVVVKEIGITERSFHGQKPSVMALEESDLKNLKTRPSHSNKGTFGKMLLIAGSVNMAGAAILAGKSAYAAGCGLVRILTPEENRIIIQTALPEAVLSTYNSKKVGLSSIQEGIDWADVIVIGPGLGTTKEAELLLKQVIKQAQVPLVLDADALNLIAKNTDYLLEKQKELVITPHLGEMSRLTGQSISVIQNDLLETAKKFAENYQVTCVLKDERTMISFSDGISFLNLSGNAGMATAGSGDVLSGILGSLLAQGYSMKQAVPLAVYLHGLAGDVMILKTGKAGLMASDLIEGVRKIFSCKEAEKCIL